MQRGPAQDDQRVGGVAQVDRDVEPGWQGLAHLVGDHAVPAVDEQVGDRPVEVEHHRPRLGQHLLQSAAAGGRFGGHGWYGRAMVAQMLLNQRAASFRCRLPLLSGSVVAVWWNSSVSLPVGS